MLWEVFRVLVGRGLVDYLGTLEATTEEKAIDQAKLMFDNKPGLEEISVEPYRECPGS